jgi:hypothetical protein
LLLAVPPEELPGLAAESMGDSKGSTFVYCGLLGMANVFVLLA